MVQNLLSYSLINVYGLHIEFHLSPLENPIRVDKQPTSDIIVRLGQPEFSAQKVLTDLKFKKQEGHFVANPQEIYLFWNDVGTFLVKEGQEIIMDPVPFVEEHTLLHFIFGPALGVLLHQRGAFALHASSILFKNEAVAFMGHPGGGKSTLAASFYRRGYPILTDDIAAINGDDNPKIWPGPRELKLWPDAATVLDFSEDSLVRIHPRLEKFIFRVETNTRIPSAPVPLKRIYVLYEGPDQEIELLNRREGFIELIRHSYCARLLPELGSDQHFLQCVHLAKAVPVYRLTRPWAMEGLEKLVNLIENHLTYDFVETKTRN